MCALGIAPTLKHSVLDQLRSRSVFIPQDVVVMYLHRFAVRKGHIVEFRLAKVQVVHFRYRVVKCRSNAVPSIDNIHSHRLCLAYLSEIRFKTVEIISILHSVKEHYGNASAIQCSPLQELDKVKAILFQNTINRVFIKVALNSDSRSYLVLCGLVNRSAKNPRVVVKCRPQAPVERVI